MTGYVYAIQSVEAVKIGFTRDIKQRVGGFLGGDLTVEHERMTKPVTPLRLVTHRSINLPAIYKDSRGDRWIIYPSAPPSFMWSYVHDDYDGAPDGNDDRFGHADSLDDCIDEIEERIVSPGATA